MARRACRRPSGRPGRSRRSRPCPDRPGAARRPSCRLARPVHAAAGDAAELAEQRRDGQAERGHDLPEGRGLAAGSAAPRSPSRARSAWFPTARPSARRFRRRPPVRLPSRRSSAAVTAALTSEHRRRAPPGRSASWRAAARRSTLMPTVIRKMPSAEAAERRGDRPRPRRDIRSRRSGCRRSARRGPAKSRSPTVTRLATITTSRQAARNSSGFLVRAACANRRGSSRRPTNSMRERDRAAEQQRAEQRADAGRRRWAPSRRARRRSAPAPDPRTAACRAPARPTGARACRPAAARSRSRTSASARPSADRAGNGLAHDDAGRRR